jgi:hypothetical protein
MIRRLTLSRIACFVLGGPAEVFACSCLSTSPIAEQVERADAVIVGRAVRLAPTAGMHEGRPLETTVVEVVSSIKGDLTGEVHVSRFSMCYQSLPSDALQVGRTYVLPLYRVNRGMPAALSEVEAISLQGASYPGLPLDRLFELAECAESGIVLKEGQGFSPEMLEGADRSVVRYLGRDVVWVVIGSLAITGVIIWRRQRQA